MGSWISVPAALRRLRGEERREDEQAAAAKVNHPDMIQRTPQDGHVATSPFPGEAKAKNPDQAALRALARAQRAQEAAVRQAEDMVRSWGTPGGGLGRPGDSARTFAPDPRRAAADPRPGDALRATAVRPGYEPLRDVLRRALDQAQHGKGVERHAAGNQPFVEQSIMSITRMVGLGFPLGQAQKKAQEATRMDRDAAVRELLGAINYLAAAVLYLEEVEKK